MANKEKDMRDAIKNMYKDFFNTPKAGKERIDWINEYNLNSDNIPEIKVEEKEETVTEEELQKMAQDKMNNFIDRLEKLHITDESKEVLKKIIEYMKKYNEKSVEEYIVFNLCIYSDDKETSYAVTELLGDAATYFNYIKKGYTVELSFYNLDKEDQVNDMYSKDNSVILMRDIEGMLLQDANFRKRFWHKVGERISINENEFLTVINAKNKDIIDNVFDHDEELKKKIFNFEVTTVKPNFQEVYEELLDKLDKDEKMSEKTRAKLLDYILNTYPKTELSYPEYKEKLYEEILFNKTEEITEGNIPDYEKDKSMDEIFAELNELVGLEKIKQVLKELVDLIELKKKAGDNLKIKDINLHMVFLGNPGTGKTTVARIIAGMLYNLKYIKQNKLVEVSSKDLVAEYVGQTAPKTMAVIERAMGGVLFIDEAYSLASGQGQGNGYNEEAIATLIQAMENYRDDLVVIFAGYTKEMQGFLNANSGIASRIGYTLEFEDYTEDELLQIFKNMVTKAGFDITEDALNEALKVIREYKDTKNFGNARFARSLFEKTIIKHASNTKNKKTNKALKTIEKEDINTENLLKM